MGESHIYYLLEDMASLSPEMSYTIHWNGYQELKNQISILKFIENNSENLRGDYISLVYEIGNLTVGSKSIEERLNINGEFSYWWMSLVAEKSPFKSKSTESIVKLLALEKILIEQGVKKIVFAGSNRRLSKALSRLCQNLHISYAFLYKRNQNQKDLTVLNFLRTYTPQLIQALALLCLKFTKASLVIRKLNWIDKSSVFICSYFFNFDFNKLLSGNFQPKQLGFLPNLIESLGISINWLTIAINNDDKSCQQFESAVNFQANRERLYFFNKYLSIPIVCIALFQWIKLVFNSSRLAFNLSRFRPRGSCIEPWALLRDDWNKSFMGVVAVENCLTWLIFEKIMSQVPHQKFGLFVWENQAWETAFIAAWRRNNHGYLIGIQTASVCFWHLNNFEDARVFDALNPSKKPLPDNLVVNGELPHINYQNLGYPKKYVIEMEAVRYRYLGELVKNNKLLKRAKISNTASAVNILLLGDISLLQTLEMIQCVRELELEVARDLVINLVIKPHPACPLKSTLIDFPQYRVVDSDLQELFLDADYVFSGNSTTAGLEAYLVGMKTAIYLDQRALNLSPLKGIKGATFISNSTELMSFILANDGDYVPPPLVESIFCINKPRHGWDKMLIDMCN